MNSPSFNQYITPRLQQWYADQQAKYPDGSLHPEEWTQEVDRLSEETAGTIPELEELKRYLHASEESKKAALSAPPDEPTAPRRRGAPTGNVNALKHGYYARQIPAPANPAYPVPSLEAEIQLLRSFLHRVSTLAAQTSCLELPQAAALLRVISLAVASLSRASLAQLYLAQSLPSNSSPPQPTPASAPPSNPPSLSPSCPVESASPSPSEDRPPSAGSGPLPAALCPPASPPPPPDDPSQSTDSDQRSTADPPRPTPPNCSELFRTPIAAPTIAGLDLDADPTASWYPSARSSGHPLLRPHRF